MSVRVSRALLKSLPDRGMPLALLARPQSQVSGSIAHLTLRVHWLQQFFGKKSSGRAQMPRHFRERDAQRLLSTQPGRADISRHFERIERMLRMPSRAGVRTDILPDFFSQGTRSRTGAGAYRSLKFSLLVKAQPYFKQQARPQPGRMSPGEKMAVPRYAQRMHTRGQTSAIDRKTASSYSVQLMPAIVSFFTQPARDLLAALTKRYCADVASESPSRRWQVVTAQATDSHIFRHDAYTSHGQLTGATAGVAFSDRMPPRAKRAAHAYRPQRRPRAEARKADGGDFSAADVAAAAALFRFTSARTHVERYAHARQLPGPAAPARASQPALPAGLMQRQRRLKCKQATLYLATARHSDRNQANTQAVAQSKAGKRWAQQQALLHPARRATPLRSSSGGAAGRKSYAAGTSAFAQQRRFLYVHPPAAPPASAHSYGAGKKIGVAAIVSLAASGARALSLAQYRPPHPLAATWRETAPGAAAELGKRLLMQIQTQLQTVENKLQARVQTRVVHEIVHGSQTQEQLRKVMTDTLLSGPLLQSLADRLCRVMEHRSATERYRRGVA
ncbi:MAG: hypothetical protein HYZ65_08750 [Burkholderiales bacterium]|nr:hypothetical protein [Burkholderiales bacterium]